jgi:hypothetical protein
MRFAREDDTPLFGDCAEMGRSTMKIGVFHSVGRKTAYVYGKKQLEKVFDSPCGGRAARCFGKAVFRWGGSARSAQTRDQGPKDPCGS